MALTKGKIYEVIALEKGPDLVKGKGEIDWLRIVCDSGEDYLFQLMENQDYRLVEA